MIPVRISPFFFLTAGFIGFINSRSLVGTLIWIGIIFISVLFHEFGHALTSKAFGQKPRIELVAFGGLTIPEGKRLKLWKEFVVIFNGPLFGFILAGITFGLYKAGFSEPVTQFFKVFWIVNLFWTVVNLFPLLPLDGGQLMRVIFEGIWGAKGMNRAMFVSMIIAAAGAMTFFLLGGILIGALFFIFAFQNFESWRQTRKMSSDDQKEEHKEAITQIEKMIQEGHREEAAPLLEDLIGKAKRGLIHDLACQHLALISHEHGDYKRAYFLLKPIEKDLAPETQLVLHKAAFEVGDLALVKHLSAKCYQLEQTAEVATRNAIAYAEEGDVDATIGWLDAAIDHGLENLDEITKQKAFDRVRHDPRFTDRF